MRNKILKTFEGLKFDEEYHVYMYNKEILPSVSSLIYNFYTPFDTLSQSESYAIKRNFIKEEVLDSWEGENKSSLAKGHEVHNFAEDYCKWRYFGEGDKPKPHSKQCLGVIDFWNSLPSYLKPVGFEIRMFNEKLFYAGTADILLLDERDNKIIIADYKTNKELFSEYDTSSLFHLDPSLGLLQNNFGKYSLQFSFYQLLLEEAGFEVKARVLIWLDEDKPNKKLYKTFQTINLTKQLKEWRTIFLTESSSEPTLQRKSTGLTKKLGTTLK